MEARQLKRYYWVYKMFERSTILFFLFISTTVFSQCDELLNKGRVAFKSGDYSEAVAHYTSCIEREDNNLNAYLQRGLSFNMLKKYDEAISDFNHVLSEQPDLANVRLSRGAALMKKKEYQKAMEDFNRILEEDSKNQEAYNNRGWCKKYLGDDKGACSDWKKSKKMGNSEAKLIMQNNGC